MTWCQQLETRQVVIAPGGRDGIFRELDGSIDKTKGIRRRFSLIIVVEKIWMDEGL
jgi:hypothetical protein